MVFGLAHLAVHGACLAASAASASESRRRREEAVRVQTVPTQYIITTNVAQHANGQRIAPQQMYYPSQQYPHQRPQMQYAHGQQYSQQQYAHGQQYNQQQYTQHHPPPMYCHQPQGPIPQSGARQYAYHPQQQYYVQGPQPTSTGGPSQLPVQQGEENENETMDRPPRRNPMKKILRRLKATCLCCATGNREKDEEPMLPGSVGHNA